MSAAQAFFFPAHLCERRSTVDNDRTFKPGIPAHPGAQPCGTTRTLVGCLLQSCPHHVPTPLRSTVITRFFATTRALTPTGPFAASRGSLIHVTRTSNHSISKHLRISTSRDPLPLRWQRYFVPGFATTTQARQIRRPKRVHFGSLTGNTRYGLVVHFQLLSTRGYRPGAVTFNYWPFSVGQVRDFHPAVQMRFQAHVAAGILPASEPGFQPRRREPASSAGGVSRASSPGGVAGLPSPADT